MKKRFLAIGIVLAGLALASLVHAQSPWTLAQETAASGRGNAAAVQSFVEQSRRRGASPEFVQEVLSEAQRMEAQGLPSGPYLLKASEGLAKGVPPERIRPALKQTELRVQTADDLVKRAVSRGATVRSPEERREAVQRMQQALLNQVSPRALERLGDTMTSRQKGMDIGQIGKAASELSRKQYSNRPKTGGSGWWKTWQAQENKELTQEKEKEWKKDRDQDREKDRDRGRKQDQEKRKEKKEKDQGPGGNGEKKKEDNSKRKGGDERGPKWESGSSQHGGGGSSGKGGSGKGKGKK